MPYAAAPLRLGGEGLLIPDATVSEAIDQPWIRGYALTPRRLSEGGWVWFGSYEWRWQRPTSFLPSAVNPPRVFTRKARTRMKTPR